MSRRNVVSSLLCSLLGAGAITWAAAPAGATENAHERSPGSTVHRVVWDGAITRGGPKTELFSAALDGTDRRLVYRSARNWVLDLTLSRDGRWVALAPMRMSLRRAPLVVANVLTGGHSNLLEGNRLIDHVGGIGWAPNGRRLVFEGTFGTGERRTTYLWTVRRDGSGLHRLADLGPPDADRAVISNSLAWTPEGIFYLGPEGLMRVGNGVERLVARGAFTEYISGNGRWLFFERTRRLGGVASLWRMHPDGSGLQRVIAQTRPHPRLGYLTSMVPDFTGSQLLTVAHGTDGPVPHGPVSYVHDATRAPRPGDATLDFTAGAYTVTWN